jgi:hypothetical protein
MAATALCKNVGSPDAKKASGLARTKDIVRLGGYFFPLPFSLVPGGSTHFTRASHGNGRFGTRNGAEAK